MNPDIDVFDALRETARQFGVEKLAALMNVRRGTLFNKLSLKPTTAHHKPTLKDFIEILTHSRDLKPLRMLNTFFGCVTYQLPDLSQASDTALLDLVNRVHICGGDVHREIDEALDDGHVSAQDFQEFDVELQEWLAAILELRARFKGMVIHAA
ncbi:phage regulatory CII family protein [Pseudogulbenkiania sp. MAI-1]|uniref:phage regulatory CII family protein n=1 Tax=Pseudogulbenkiania sp. MAI-1 TaxID=990370 RepID=UPI00045EC429|nr:phage regulatory CII family protein [Pseudogulbenkiania sp. MAI-1]